jgi:hypothetical protein
MAVVGLLLTGMAVLGMLLLLRFIILKVKGNKEVFQGKPSAGKQEMQRDRAAEKGREGEERVKGLLAKLGPEYTYVHDVMIPGNNDDTSQIDHVVISPYGIFIIETKTYNGYIKGYENAQKWVQFLRKSRYEFYNPIKQNEGHIKALRNLFKDKNKILPMYSIVVFVGARGLEVEAITAKVIQETELLDTIQSYDTIRLTVDNINIIKNYLHLSDIIDVQAREQHVLTIHKREEQIRNGICPNCNSSLVERAGKYGTFLGCSGYPRCRFKVNTAKSKEFVKS